MIRWASLAALASVGLLAAYRLGTRHGGDLAVRRMGAW